MRVFVIMDIHLKSWIFDQTDEILRVGKAERMVCRMDVPECGDQLLCVGLLNLGGGCGKRR